MNCKFCNEPLEEGVTVCPNCQAEQPQLEEDITLCPDCPQEEFPVEEAVSTAPAKPKLWKLILAVVGCLVLLGVLTVSVLEGMGIDATGKIAGIFQKEEAPGKEDAPKEEDLSGDSDVVVATIGDRELTNGELQVYYWTHVFDYINYYYYSELGFDMEKPLDEQIKDEKTQETWHDYFLDMALNSWHRYEAMAMIAQESGHTLSKETQDYLDNLETYLTETATQSGFEDADAMIADRFGPGCALRHYAEFMENYCIGLDFFDLIAADVAPTDKEIDAYYAENEKEMKEAGASKEDGNVASVRHILISPKGEKDATTFTDAQWAAALASAEALLEQWKAGDATEESFTELAIAHSEDPGVAENSGLYAGISKTANYVESFKAWAIDPARTEGETGIVKTDYGYHIMYYISGEPMWKSTCYEAIITQRISAKIDTVTKENPVTSDADKVVLGDALANKTVN